MQENTFYALIYLSLNGETSPSTRVPATRLLALRTRAPIFVEDEVIDHVKTVDVLSEHADRTVCRSGRELSIRTTWANTRWVAPESVRWVSLIHGHPGIHCSPHYRLTKCSRLC